MVEDARRSVAALLACPPERVIFTSGGTEGNNAIIKGVFNHACAAAGRGHIVTSRIEHDSILGACRQVEEQGGGVTYLTAGSDGRVRAEDVRAALRPETILISVMHGNNETGAIQPIPEIAAIAREAGVPLHTDAVQTYGKIPTRVDDLGCEFLTLTRQDQRSEGGRGHLLARATPNGTPWTRRESGNTAAHGTKGVHQIVGWARPPRGRARWPPSMRASPPCRAQIPDGLKKIRSDARVKRKRRRKPAAGSLIVTFPASSGIRCWPAGCYEVGVSMVRPAPPTASAIACLLGWVPEAVALTTCLCMGARRPVGVRYAWMSCARCWRRPGRFRYLDRST